MHADDPLDDNPPTEPIPFFEGTPFDRTEAESRAAQEPSPPLFCIGDRVEVRLGLSWDSGRIGTINGVELGGPEFRHDTVPVYEVWYVDTPRRGYHTAVELKEVKGVKSVAAPKPGDAPNGNPKDAIGSTKLRLGVLPWNALVGPALALTDGALKYGRHNWRRSEIRAEVYFDAAQRHLLSWWEGEDTAADSGLHHVDHAIAGLLILRDSILRGSLVDDRPPVSPGAFIAEANAAAAELSEGRTSPAPPATEL